MEDLKQLRESIQQLKQKSIVLDTTLTQYRLQKEDLEKQIAEFELSNPNIENEITMLEQQLSQAKFALDSELSTLKI